MTRPRSELLAYSERILAEFLHSDVGSAIIDAEFRYLAVNSCLAAYNGVAPEHHIGKHLREILGITTALQVEAAIKQVLATGKPVVNQPISGPLPCRPEGGHWIHNFFPILDSDGNVKEVGIVVVELQPSLQIEPPKTAPSAHSLLRSWKDIAQYLGTCVKTVQRWERQQGLPVRRVSVTKGSVVFALVEEVESWLKTRMTRNDSHRDVGVFAEPSTSETTANHGAAFSPAIPDVGGRSPKPLPAHGKPLVLCVEDDPKYLTLRQKVLERDGYNVIGVARADDALKVLREAPVCAVIADHMLYGTTGTGLARRMKEIKPEVPVILLSGNMPEQLDGIDVFIHKGEPTAGFLRVVREVVERSR